MQLPPSLCSSTSATCAPSCAARTRDWKLVFYAGKPYGELYHLAEDPDELHNLYETKAHRSTRLELEERMLHWYGETRFRRQYTRPKAT